jgi:hypothetical protein
MNLRRNYEGTEIKVRETFKLEIWNCGFSGFGHRS